MNLDIILKAGAVQRYHTVDCDHHQTNADHSWGVGVILCMICEPSAMLLKAALLHDAAEYWLGDIPAHAKWQHEPLAEAFKMAEEKVEWANGIRFDLSFEDKCLLKCADIIELLVHCLRQIRRGNRNFKEIFDRGIKFIHDNHEMFPPKARNLIATLTQEYSTHV